VLSAPKFKAEEAYLWRNARYVQSNADGVLNRTMLSLAIDQYQVMVLKELLEAGADPNELIVQDDKNQFRPLHQVTHEMFKLLETDDRKDILGSRRTDQRKRKMFFLMMMLEMLLFYVDKEDVNAKTGKLDQISRTALVFAAESKHVAACELLLRHGADPTVCVMKGAEPTLILATGVVVKSLENLLMERRGLQSYVTKAYDCEDKGVINMVTTIYGFLWQQPDKCEKPGAMEDSIGDIEEFHNMLIKEGDSIKQFY